jgi:hypothetical protein
MPPVLRLFDKGVYILFGMAIYIAVIYLYFSTGCSHNTSKITTKTVPKAVRNGLIIDRNPTQIIS